MLVYGSQNFPVLYSRFVLLVYHKEIKIMWEISRSGYMHLQGISDAGDKGMEYGNKGMGEQRMMIAAVECGT